MVLESGRVEHVLLRSTAFFAWQCVAASSSHALLIQPTAIYDAQINSQLTATGAKAVGAAGTGESDADTATSGPVTHPS